MSDIKFCDSCGNKISITALFCPKCGQKQETIPVLEAAAPIESIEQDATSVTQVVKDDIDFIQEQAFEETVNNENTFDASNSVDTINDFENPIAEPVNESVVEPVKADSTIPVENEVVKPEVPQSQQSTYIPQPQQQTIHQPQVPQQPQPQYQQPYYPQNTQAPVVQSPAETVKKKKFPWIFSLLWFILLVAVGVWAYFLLVDPNYDYPRFTEDAQRIALFTAAIAALIYTLSLKLTMRKLKALPTVIMIILALVGFFFFCLVELQDGEFLHDAVSTFVENVLQ